MTENKSQNQATLGLGIDLRDTMITFVARNHNGELESLVEPAKIGIKNGEIVAGKAATDSSQSVANYSNIKTETGSEFEGRVPLAIYLEKQLDKFREQIRADDSFKLPPEQSDPIFQTVTVALPAGIPTGAQEKLMAVIDHLDIDEKHAIRRPTPLILTSETESEPGYIIAVNVTNRQLELGVYSVTEEGDVTVLARTVDRDLGRRRILNEISREVIERTAKNLETTVEYDDKALSSVAEAIEEKLTTTGSLQESSVEVDITEGMQIKSGNEIHGNKLHIETALNQSLINSGLDVYNDKLMELFTTIDNSLNLDNSKVTSACIVDETLGLDIHSDAIQAVWDIYPKEAAEPKRRIAKDAIIQDTNPLYNKDVALKETTHELVHISALGESGIEKRPVVKFLPTSDGSCSMSLRTKDPQQQYGKFELNQCHPVTEEAIKTTTVVVSGMKPDRRSVSEVMVGIGFDDEDLSLEVESSSSSEVAITVEEKSDAPWLVHGDIPEDVSLPDVSEESFVYAQQIEADDTGAVDRERVAEIIQLTRSDLWSHSIKEERKFSPSDMEVVLNEFDSRLERLGIEFFVPEIGSEVDPRREYISEVQESTENEGTIIEVLSPGVLIDGDPVITADVVIAAE